MSLKISYLDEFILITLQFINITTAHSIERDIYSEIMVSIMENRTLGKRKAQIQGTR